MKNIKKQVARLGNKVPEIFSSPVEIQQNSPSGNVSGGHSRTSIILKIEHIKGKSNVVADALSRLEHDKEDQSKGC